MALEAGQWVVSAGAQFVRIGDLKVSLRSPAGTIVVLHDHEGRNGDDIIRTWTSDDFDKLQKLHVKLIALVDAMRDMGRPAANTDVGIVALCYALGLPAGSGAALFAVGRTAGWIAHVLEQYEAGFLLRPRATPPGL